jgi:TctA family transporter
MDFSNLLSNLALGLTVAETPQNLFWCLMGAIIGTAVGVLPGLGPVATMALLLPVTYYLPPEGALIMLAGIYYGAQYGGSTTAILVNLPGESSSVVTCLDGYQMARQGRAGPALAIAAIGSFFAGCVSTVLIAVAAPPLVALAQSFGPADYCSLMVFGLVTAIVMASGSILKAVAMIFFGLLLGIVGTDVNTGNLRYDFGIGILFDGINFVPIAMGVFGINEIMANLTNPERRDVLSSRISGLMPTWKDIKESSGAIVRGTVLGSLLGILPGGGALLASFASYSLEKKVSKTPEKFGTGIIQGVAGPESANNAAAQTSFIPMLTLGIPSNAVMAMMVGGMMIHGIIPGPQVMTDKPGLFWGMIVSMWIGNVMLIVFNLPLVGIWVKMLTVPYRLLSVSILFFCCIGVYSVNNSAEEVLLITFFGLLGYALIKMGCEPAPMLLGFILGPMMETYLRRAMLLSRGDPWVFVQRPISLGFLIAAAILLVIIVLPNVRKVRQQAFVED